MKAKKKTKLYEWQQRVNNGDGACSKCGRKDHLTVDHVIPVSLLNQLCIPKEEHYDDEENFDILCRWCNRQKGAELDHLNPKTPKLLQKYVSRYIYDISLNN